MKLLLDQQRTIMRSNGQFNATRTAEGQTEIDFMPVVKLFTPWGGNTWLLSELDPGDHDVEFGLCDLGMGCPELGTVRLSELEAVKGPFGLGVERDLGFTANKTLSAYADEARAHQRIVA